MTPDEPDAGGEQPRLDLAAIVDELCTSPASLAHRMRGEHGDEPLPSFEAIIRVIERLRTVLFPGYFGDAEVRPETLRFHAGHSLDAAQRRLRQQIERGFAFECKLDRSARGEHARAVTDAFLARLPAVQNMLAEDVHAAYEGDPAARSHDEAIFCYPGVLAIFSHRMAHELYKLEVPLLPRMISEHAHSITGIDIHPGATIGPKFFIDHGTGVVIGQTCEIGARVRIYQGVTLGAKSFPLDEAGNPIKGVPRHPIIEDDVIVYSGATILGRVTIGRGSIIGGNVWLTRSVPAGSRVSVQAPKHETFEAGGGI